MDNLGPESISSSERERSAIECLISCSEDLYKEEVFDRFVVTSSWEEVARGWRNTKPNSHYISSPERRKKPKEKAQNSPTFIDQESQLSRVKKLAGLITNSNALHDSNSWSKVGQLKNPTLIKYQNTNVLSYDVPCWRYIVDPKKYRYIERLSLQQLRTLNDRRTNVTQTILLENGGMITCQELHGNLAFLDPALSFDKHLLEILDLREEFRLRSTHHGSCMFDYSSITQFRTEDNKIKVIHTVASRSDIGPCGPGSMCEMCRHRTQELAKNDIKILSCSNSGSELKPLQKITPTQRRVAEDSLLAGKALMQHARSKDLLTKSDSSSTGCKASNKCKEGKGYTRQFEPRLDWLPITRSTIGYPYVQNMTGGERISHGRFPDRPSPGTTKTFALPRNNRKARKLTLSEAANLVPKTTGLGDAIKKLSKELEEKNGNPLSINEPMLPTVSGTKLEVPLSAACDS